MAKRASEMTIEQIEDVLEGMDWTEIHKAQVWGDYGASIVLYTDGTFSVQEQSTYYRDPDAAGVIGYLHTKPWGNCDSSVYFEEWVEKVRDGVENTSEWITWDDEAAVYRHTQTGDEVSEGYVVEIETGRVMDETTAVDEAIENGEWDYDEEIRAFMEQYADEARYRAEEAESLAASQEAYEAAMTDVDPRDA